MFRQQSEPRGGVATEEPVGDESCDQEVVNKMYRAMAQLVARLHGVQEVGGSSPPSPTSLFVHLTRFFFKLSSHMWIIYLLTNLYVL